MPPNLCLLDHVDTRVTSLAFKANASSFPTCLTTHACPLSFCLCRHTKLLARKKKRDGSQDPFYSFTDEDQQEQLQIFVDWLHSQRVSGGEFRLTAVAGSTKLRNPPSPNPQPDCLQRARTYSVRGILWSAPFLWLRACIVRACAFFFLFCSWLALLDTVYR